MFQILIVCTANICRSPATQLIFQRLLSKQNVVVDSAGTLAIDGNPMDDTMQTLMLAKGYTEATGHRSKALMPMSLARYDLILAMENNHMQHIHQMNPAVVGRVKLLGNWDNKTEVDDPYRRSEKTYEKSIVQMEQLSSVWVDKMIQTGMVA